MVSTRVVTAGSLGSGEPEFKRAVVVDLPKELFALDFDAAEVVLAVRIITLIEGRDVRTLFISNDCDCGLELPTLWVIITCPRER